ncbi:MAG: hypothetical protein CMJ80_04430 [Planctomycetaceae bacterium]|nr:hypothetical protein [Planctomycetaceae bacterium]
MNDRQGVGGTRATLAFLEAARCASSDFPIHHPIDREDRHQQLDTRHQIHTKGLIGELRP